LSSTKRPTIEDVAAHSGVAKATVSRVLNGGPNVRQEVRERVRRSVEAIGYKVNLQARILAGGAMQQLIFAHESVLDAEPNSYYHSGLELGALRACAEKGFTLSALALDPSAQDCTQRLLAAVEGGQADGVILSPPFSDDLELIQALIRERCPVVCISGGADSRAIAPSVGIDDDAAGYAIGRFLLDLGHRRFGYIDGPAGHVSAAYRFKGLLRALGEDQGDVACAERGDFTFRSGSMLAERIFTQQPGITALICANDDMATGAMLTAHRRGLAIPGQISIAGFDDTPVSEIIWPPLTTVHQPIRQMGQRAANRLIEAIQMGGAVAPTPELVPFRVVERASTGPVQR
jgi:LacI family transcriptional regulator